VSTGDQFLASVRRGPRGDGGIVLNGPLTRRGVRGDGLMIFRYDYIREGTRPVKAPILIRLDCHNRIVA
jgi:aspartate 1-decarboxylase